MQTNNTWWKLHETTVKWPSQDSTCVCTHRHTTIFHLWSSLLRNAATDTYHYDICNGHFSSMGPVTKEQREHDVAMQHCPSVHTSVLILCTAHIITPRCILLQSYVIFLGTLIRQLLGQLAHPNINTHTIFQWTCTCIQHYIPDCFGSTLHVV